MTPEELVAMNAAVLAAVAPLQAEIAALKAAPAKKLEPAPLPEEKAYTRADLDAAVQAGTITAIQANDILDTQHLKQTARLVKEAVRAEAGNLTRTQIVERDTAEYEALIPAVLVAGSKERGKVQAQYDYLVSIGQPATEVTELVALGMVYGPIDTLKAAKRVRTKPETHEEVGGGDRDFAGNDDDDNAPPADIKLSKAQMRFYQEGIQKRIYAGWDAVKAELKFAKTKPGARAH